MNLIKIVLAASFLISVNCAAASGILLDDRQGSAESIFAARTIDDAMYDDIMNSTNNTDIRKYFTKLGNEAVTIHAPNILLKAIMKGNKVAVDTLISLGADPFKNHRMYKLTAWDFLSVIPDAELSIGQRAIKADMQQKYTNRPEMSRNLSAFNSLKSMALRRAPRFSDLDNYKKIFANTDFSNILTYYNINLSDGSSPLQQTIIGNNFKLFSSFMSISDIYINYRWDNKNSTIDFLDIKEIKNINPIGWTALMVAVEFYRVEMVKIILAVADTNVLIKAGNVDAFTLARRLPDEKKRVILPLLKAKLKNVAAPASCAGFTNLKGAIEKGASNDCLTFFVNKETMDLNILTVAVTYLTDITILNEILAESENIFKTERGIHKKLWTAFKQDTKSESIENYQAKLTKMVSYGFKFEERNVYVDNSGGMTPVEEACIKSEVNENLALALILSSSTINKLQGRNEAPITLAVKNDRVKIVLHLLMNARKLNLNYEIDCNAEKENLVHFSITWIKNEDCLIEILRTLLILKPEYLNTQSSNLVQNTTSYKLNEVDVNYTMFKRSRWTPLMYAVMMRKNKVARFLAGRGANKAIKGLDNVDVNEIIEKRCAAYNFASQFTSCTANDFRSAFDDGVKVLVEVNTHKKEYNTLASARIVEAIKAEIQEKFSY
jgi:hypothetical protein